MSALEKLVGSLSEFVDTRRPDSEEFNGSHAIFLYSDGEMMMTKAGDLFGLRTEHCIVWGAGQVIPELDAAIRKGAHGVRQVRDIEYVLIHVSKRYKEVEELIKEVIREVR